MKKYIPRVIAAALVTGIARAADPTIIVSTTVTEGVVKAMTICSNLNGSPELLGNSGVSCTLPNNGHLSIAVEHVSLSYSIVIWRLTPADEKLNAEILSALTASMADTGKKVSGLPVYSSAGAPPLADAK